MKISKPFPRARASGRRREGKCRAWVRPQRHKMASKDFVDSRARRAPPFGSGLDRSGILRQIHRGR